MSEEQESSVLFSLQELMSLEEERIQTEEADHAAQVASAEQTRMAAEAQARREEEERIRAEEQRRVEAERGAREEAARLEAIKHAEVEKARAEAEQRARMEQMASQQAHEHQLTALRENEGKKKLKKTLIGLAVGVVLIGGLGIYIGVTSYQENQRAIAAKEAEARQLKQQAEQKERELKAKLDQINNLEKKMAMAADPKEIERLKQELESAKTDAKSIRRTGGRRPGGKKPTAAPARKCQPGDPLCSDI